MWLVFTKATKAADSNIWTVVSPDNTPSGKYTQNQCINLLEWVRKHRWHDAFYRAFERATEVEGVPAVVTIYCFSFPSLYYFSSNPDIRFVILMVVWCIVSDCL